MEGFSILDGDEQLRFKAGLMDWKDGVCKARHELGYALLVQEDVIIVEDAYMKPIHGDKARAARAFAVCFTSSDKKIVLWMQDPDASKDADIVSKFNQITNCEIDEPQIQSMAAAASSVTPAPVASPAAASTGLDNMMSQLFAALGGAQPGSKAPKRVSLESFLTSDAILSLVSPSLSASGGGSAEDRAELLALLPPGQQTLEGLKECLRSTEVREAMEGVSQAVYSEQVQGLVAAMGGNPADLELRTNPMGALVRILTEKAKTAVAVKKEDAKK